MNKNIAAERTALLIVCAIAVCLIVFNGLLLADTLAMRGPGRSMTGVMPLVVLSDSMYPTLEAGDLIIVRQSETECLKSGDIIAFYDDKGEEPVIVTHRIVSVGRSDDGSAAYTTQGDGNNTPDRDKVRDEDVIGSLRYRIAGAGRILLAIRNSLPWICAVLAVSLAVFVLRIHPQGEGYEDA